MTEKSLSGSSSRHLLHPKLTVLVTCTDEGENSNIITLAWGMPVSMDPPLVAISVGKERYSHDLISDHGEFVVNIPEGELLNEVIFCGSKSGEKVDKFEGTGLTPEESQEVETPSIKECAAKMECRLEDKLEAGDHTIFVGKVLANSVDERVFDLDSEIYDVDTFEPVLHMGGPNFVTIGKKLD